MGKIEKLESFDDFDKKDEVTEEDDLLSEKRGRISIGKGQDQVDINIEHGYVKLSQKMDTGRRSVVIVDYVDIDELIKTLQSVKQ